MSPDAEYPILEFDPAPEAVIEPAKLLKQHQRPSTELAAEVAAESHERLPLMGDKLSCETQWSAPRGYPSLARLT